MERLDSASVMAMLRRNILPTMDNCNVTASQDQFLDVMLKYRCRILFTTRSRYENRISQEVGEQKYTLICVLKKYANEGVFVLLWLVSIMLFCKRKIANKKL